MDIQREVTEGLTNGKEPPSPSLSPLSLSLSLGKEWDRQEGSSTRRDWKVGYGGPYMGGKGKSSALMG